MIWRTKIRVVGGLLIIAIIASAIIIPYGMGKASCEKTKKGVITFSSKSETSVHLQDEISFLKIEESKKNHTSVGDTSIGLKFSPTYPIQNFSFSMRSIYSFNYGYFSISDTKNISIQSVVADEMWHRAYHEPPGWFGLSLGFCNSSALIFNPDRAPLNITLGWRWNLTEEMASGDTYVAKLVFSVMLSERLHLYDMNKVRIASFWVAVVGSALVIVTTWKYQSVKIR